MTNQAITLSIPANLPTSIAWDPSEGITDYCSQPFTEEVARFVAWNTPGRAVRQSFRLPDGERAWCVFADLEDIQAWPLT